MRINAVGDVGDLTEAQPYSNRFRFSQQAAEAFMDEFRSRADEVCELADVQPLATEETEPNLTTNERRVAERVAEFKAVWDDERPRRREVLANLPRPTDEPVVSPNLTNNFPFTYFSTIIKVKAELDARGISYDQSAPLRKRSAKKPEVVPLIELLKPHAKEDPKTKVLHLTRMAVDEPLSTSSPDAVFFFGISPESDDVILQPAST